MTAARIKVDEERRAKDLADRTHFEALFAEWLENRAALLRWDGKSDLIADDDKHGDRETELARLITTTPAVFPWMIFYKLQVLEHYLGGSGGTSWTDNREVMMLAGIKADLLRFEPHDRGEGSV